MQIFQKNYYNGTCEIINLKTKSLQSQRPNLHMKNGLKLGTTAILVF